MLLEIRTYTLQPGRREEFVAFFENDVMPAMQDVGMSLYGPFVSEEDPNVFVYLRTFRDEAQRHQQASAFYASDAWLGSMRDRALAMEQSYEVAVVTSTDGARCPA